MIADEADASDWWFPANDHPLDKATYDTSITTPQGTTAISNGLLVATTQHHLTHTTTHHWRETKPMATYLAFAAIGKYQVKTSRTSTGLPVVEAYEQGGMYTHAMELARRDVSQTAGIVGWLSEQWGPYPFDAAGGVVPDFKLGYALETQTRPTYGVDFWTSKAAAQYALYDVVHENAHQWFGDSVSVHRWKDIWMNEGFATFNEWLWGEDKDHIPAQARFDYEYAQYGRNDPFWKVLVADPGVGNIFSAAVYDRGGMTLQALRNKIGNAAFRATLRDWVASHKYGNGRPHSSSRWPRRSAGATSAGSSTCGCTSRSDQHRRPRTGSQPAERARWPHRRAR